MNKFSALILIGGFHVLKKVFKKAVLGCCFICYKAKFTSLSVTEFFRCLFSDVCFAMTQGHLTD